MPDDTRCANGSVVGDLLSVATLLKNPHLTGLYAYLYREEPATVREVMNALDFSRETTQTLLSRLEEMGTVETLSDDEPQKYRADSIELSLSVISATMDMVRRYIAAADNRSEHNIEQTDAEVGGATAMLLERGDRSPSTRMIYQRFEGSNGR
jgi:predicted transcriptional regulator